MAFTKVDEDIILHGGVTPLPDSPQLQPAALKAKFDEKGQAACETFNNFVDEISAPATGAINIGVTVPDNITSVANVQALFNTIAVMAVASENERHTHDNKTVLDDITAITMASVNDLVTLMSGVTSIETSSMNPASTSELPTSSAVAAYFTAQRNTIMNMVYPIGCVVLTNNMDPADLFNYGTWTVVDTVKTMTAYTRTA